MSERDDGSNIAGEMWDRNAWGGAALLAGVGVAIGAIGVGTGVCIARIDPNTESIPTPTPEIDLNSFENSFNHIELNLPQS